MSEYPTFHWGMRTYVMGVVNVTPDSFSGDGLLDSAQAIARGLDLAANGSDILDVGGASSRPGSVEIDAAEERRRIIPVIKGLRERLDVPISIDTWRAEVASAACDAGATMVNDVWGFQRDADLAGVVASRGTWAIAMHNRTATAETSSTVGGYFPEVEYHNLLAEIIDGLRQSVDVLVRGGVARERIIVDPGIGFGKTPRHNLQLLARLGELSILGLPILIGTSRKSFIGMVLNLPPQERVEGTAATVAIGIANGADIVRVHDLPAMARVARMADAIVRGDR